MKITDDQVVAVLSNLKIQYEKIEDGEFDTQYGLIQLVSNNSLVWVEHEKAMPNKVLNALKELEK